MSKQAAILILFLALLVPVGCQTKEQAQVDQQVENKLASQNIKHVDAHLQNDGTVELTGNVPNENDRMLAERTARSVSGVKNVVNNIKVKYEPVDTDNSKVNNTAKEKDNYVPNDTWLSFKTKLALYADKRVSGSDINVESKDGVVSLIGKVPSNTEKDAAVQVAKKVVGVRTVEDQLQVVPASERKVVNDNDDNITKNVKTAIKNEQVAKNGSFTVNVNDGVVSLTGTADNMNQVMHAVQETRKVKGVKAVNADAVVVKNQEADNTRPVGSY